LPGGTRDPRRRPAGSKRQQLLRAQGIAGKHESIWENISRAYANQCLKKKLYCN
jgi:hypothetical protein